MIEKIYRMKIFYRDSMKSIDNTKIGIKSIIESISKEHMLTVENHIINSKHITDFKLFKIKVMEEPAPNEIKLTSNEIEIPLKKEEVEEIFKMIDGYDVYRGDE